MKRILAVMLVLIMTLSFICTAFAETTFSRFSVPNTEAFCFVNNLKVGLNLGNTFDAYDENVANELDYETVWCGVKTTPEMIHAIKAAGFQTIRLPVSWHNHLSDTKNYIISAAWLDQVKEVVDYCMKEEMYVILNIHHDDSMDFIYPSSAKASQSVKYITAIWSQLAETFKNYDEHLIFESMNEPRLVGSLYEWSLNLLSPACVDAIRQINKYNQAFVDAVRKSGGKNASRYLLCPGYDGSVEGVINTWFTLPEDPAKNDHHIMVAVHAYTPEPFAKWPAGIGGWSSKCLMDKAGVTSFMDLLYAKFIAKGIPVVIDEFGAVAKNNQSARADYAGFYVSCARERGMSCLWWDNNIASGSGERFGLLDRSTLQWSYPEIAEALVKSA